MEKEGENNFDENKEDNIEVEKDSEEDVSEDISIDKEPVIEGEGKEIEVELEENGSKNESEELSQSEIEDQFSFDKEDKKAEAVREDIAEKFKERVELDEEKEKYEAIQPQLKTNYWWTILLVTIITICLAVIVFLMVTRGTSHDTVNTNEQILTFNEKKSRYDQSLVDAVNKMVEAAAAYNQGNYANANDLSKEAERGFSTTLDYLYDLQTIELGDGYVFLSEYYRNLEDVAVAGENMGDALAFSARSADRGQSDEALSSLQDYKGYMKDFSDVSSKIELLVKDNSDFFVE